MKKTIALFLALALLLSVPAFAFSDVSDDPDLSVRAATLQSLGVLDGYTDGTLQPNTTLTRAQFSKLVVLLAGYEDSVGQYARMTLFSDVLSGSWAAGYVNLAYKMGYIAGYGNGYFGPNDSVTYGQAVTILLRLLGYTSSDIGSFWPDDYVAAAARLGLSDGLTLGAYDTLTRGQAVTLLTNLLWQDTADGKSLISTLAAQTLSGAIVTANSVTGDDGSQGNARIAANGDLKVYTQENTIPDALLGQAGTLLLDSSGRVTGFVPDEGSYTDIVVESVTASAVTDRAGKTYSIGSGAILVSDGEYQTYELGFASLYAGRPLRIFKNMNGVVTMLWVVAEDDAALGDVMLTGAYESAYPNTSAPSEMTLMGHTFELTASASAQLAEFSLGNQVTIVLTTDGRVGKVASPTKLRASAPVGILTSETTVKLLNGLAVSGTITLSDYTSVSSLIGALVTVTSGASGKLTVSDLSYSGSLYNLYPADRMLGDYIISDDVRIFERIGKTVVAEISLSDIPYATVAASSIAHYRLSSDGEVDLILLNDVTGDCYTYGMYIAGVEQVKSGSFSYYSYTLAVENAEGTTDSVTANMEYEDGAFGGIAITPAGKLAGTAALNRYTGVSLSDFTGLTSVWLGGGAVAISDDVQAYNSETETWTTLAAAKAWTDSFTVYVYKDKVRVVVTE